MNLVDARVAACIIVNDMEKAKEFYGSKIGLKEVSSPDQGGMLFEAGQGTFIFVYQSNAAKPQNTVAAFKVDNVLETVNELKAKGITFESYDMDPIKTDENNIAHLGSIEAAWFKDEEGNILGLSN